MPGATRLLVLESLGDPWVLELQLQGPALADLSTALTHGATLRIHPQAPSPMPPGVLPPRSRGGGGRGAPNRPVDLTGL